MSETEINFIKERTEHYYLFSSPQHPDVGFMTIVPPPFVRGGVYPIIKTRGLYTPRIQIGTINWSHYDGSATPEEFARNEIKAALERLPCP